ncbi:GTP-binding protein 2 [Fulvia fulva]|uniref:GTP-binding protein 2 n=1 Tax=Passalora fulva TaxID=5499 RepID=A0A9Q8PJB9_PASFU|nr:GTP-binding protein 2 [Fulvia fulva]KAK4612220.1 GTP-binding protein 2 [Fulvia fulva]KAK4613150.1 GTP-binding protein 2 [Fulvia fulva]UJO23462.1 GTP-binding protein 2 [Fulvia fulva]WPV21592.1 GTP-binding protein 2 [Fulvia fulva]WPV36518.1 GTP-binding protein 2 [Fulvia fulva]
MSMASIFTWEPEPPRVHSPWLQGADTPEGVEDHNGEEEGGTDLNLAALSLKDGAQSGNRVTRLKAEPQDGPVEYKLHLLLRARRKFRSTSTGSMISGSKHSKFNSNSPAHIAEDSGLDSTNAAATPPQASTHQTRQHRLEQLTTQLLWRLQQSSPHHTSSATNIILPSLPDALPELVAPQQPARLLHGLEESQGALYEIGVSDDGTLIGLAEDEMSESLNNLRAMAACLGCVVEVLRNEVVGECEWLEDVVVSKEERKVQRSGKLLVAEAFVKPYLHAKSPPLAPKELAAAGQPLTALPSTVELTTPATEQLRITLTGPTMSGKSTLLGTLTTSTLDNGRGKSRLSMLRHRHEITSGMTSSVTQELLGYQDSTEGSVEVVNYATENIASWIDIHAAAAGSRLVFVSDSAGHPRYRRTTLRGLVGWAPHWTLLCIPADDTKDTTPQISGSSGSPHLAAVPDMDLSGAQLDLCLRLNLPLVVVITKLDLASRSGLRESLTKVLDALKKAGKRPAIIPNRPGVVVEADVQSLPASLIETAYQTALPLLNDAREVVPIVLTSAVEGTGVGNLHVLLHELPLPAAIITGSPESSLTIFDVEDVYSKPAEVAGVIVSGHLRCGQITVGDTIVVGPFSGHEHGEDSEDSDERPLRRASSGLPTSRSFPGALRDSLLSRSYFHLPRQEWRHVKVTSIRNLRLPVHALHADQVGTLALTLDEHEAKTAPLARVRKGMVLTAMQTLATRTFTARFQREDLDTLAVGNHVVVYMSSVRASAKVISARAPDSPVVERQQSATTEPFSFDLDVGLDVGLDGQNSPVAGVVTATHLLVTFSLDASKEFVLPGDQVLVMPGGGPGLYGGTERGEKGLAGLEGFVGEIVDVHG